jgi:histidine triad (HIT) family protein
MEPDLFTQIIDGKIPCHKVYEDESTFAFMDIHPIQPGMIVVVSKQQVDNLEDLSHDMYQSLWAAVHKISTALRKSFPGSARVAVRVEGLEVPHAHAVIYPFTTSAEYCAVPSSEINHEELASLSEKIRSNL